MRVLPRSLFSHLAVVQIVYGLLLACSFLAVIGLTHARYHLEATQRMSLGWAGGVLARHRDAFTSAVFEANDAQLRNLLSEFSRFSLAIDYYVIDEAGKILLSSVPGARRKAETVDIGAVASVIQNPQVLPVTLADPTDPGVSRIFSAAPIGRGGAPAAYLLLVLRGQDSGAFLTHQRSRVLLESAVMIVGASILAFGAAIILLGYISKPIRRLSGDMIQFRKESGIAWPSANTSEGTELERLGFHFREMADQITDLLHRLKDEDRRMREMFANISHDLRTPLTVIQGCLESARTTATSLPVVDRWELIGTALAQSRSLGRLIDGVFELSKLESADYQLHREPFSIAELVQDIVIKFSLKAAAREIAVRIRGDAKHIQVTADVFLIERVFDNLFENALRHAKGAREVWIQMQEHRDSVEILVWDDGSGISAERWHNLVSEDSSRRISTQDQSEARRGLGLRIVRRILELHHTALELVPAAGKGAKFRFTLEKATPAAALLPPSVIPRESRPSAA